MEIKTTEELFYDLEYTTDKELNNKRWVAVDDIIKDLKERKDSVEQARGVNPRDYGYLQAIECLLYYYEELVKEGKE